MEMLDELEDWIDNMSDESESCKALRRIIREKEVKRLLEESEEAGFVKLEDWPKSF